MFSCEAFNILRKAADLILSLFHLMAGASIEAIRNNPENAMLKLQVAAISGEGGGCGSLHVHACVCAHARARPMHTVTNALARACARALAQRRSSCALT